MDRPFDSNDRTSGFDFSDFAQEFLRHNSAYRQQYARIAGASGFATAVSNRATGSMWSSWQRNSKLAEHPCKKP